MPTVRLEGQQQTHLYGGRYDKTTHNLLNSCLLKAFRYIFHKITKQIHSIKLKYLPCRSQVNGKRHFQFHYSLDAQKKCVLSYISKIDC